MAEEINPEVEAQVSDTVAETAKDMDVENVDTPDQTDGGATVNGVKRPREEGDETKEEDNGGEGKKMKSDEKSVEEERLENSDSADGDNGTDTVPTGPVTVGLKTFETSVEMFDYFYKFLHYWPPNFNVNKYEHLMLLELLKKGHLEPEKKIKEGVVAFQVRFHPEFKSRCFFLVREDGTHDDFSFRKCVDHILPLPENMQLKPEVNKVLGGGHGGRGGGRGGNWRGRGRGRGGKPRNQVFSCFTRSLSKGIPKK